MRLSRWLQKHGCDDEQFADLVGVERATISRIRRGLNRPSWRLAAKILVATGGEVTANDFLPTRETAE